MRLPDVNRVALDTETLGLFADEGARVASVGLAWEGGSLGLPFDQGIRDKLPNAQLDMMEQGGDPNLGETEWRELLAWLADRELVFHNAKYDLWMMFAGTRHWKGVDLSANLHFDTQLGSSLLDPRLPEGLDKAAKRAGLEGKSGLEELQKWLTKRKFKKSEYDKAPWYLVEPYVCTDAEQTWDLYKHQQGRLEYASEQVKRWIDLEHDLLKVLFKMEQRGVGLNVKASYEAAEALEARMRVLAEKLPFAPTDTKAKGYFFGDKNLTADRFSEKTGNPSLDAEQLDRWVAEGTGSDEVDSVAADWLEYKTATRAVSMWYRGYPDKIGSDGRLRLSFKQTRVKSGRMSVERVNLQAMPRPDRTIKMDGVIGVRKLLIPKKGHHLYSLDLSQAELRVAAEYAKCHTMLDLLAQGADFHGITAENVLGAKKGTENWTRDRYIAKRLTFAAIFQVGAETFQATLSKDSGMRLPLAQCEQIVRGWRNQYPEFGWAYGKAKRMAENKKYVRLLPFTEYESRSYFGELDYEKTAWSRIVQGSLAQFFKLWQIEVEKRWPGLLILTIHDSLLMEIPYRLGPKISKQVAALGQKMATDLFMRPESGVVMGVDIERW